ncbi:MAG: hypothetical protein IKJ45_08730, partial [Kiritimatiellae bacterium]|nr:hypothetical protein [Kiritimatiellia bacterium]
ERGGKFDWGTRNCLLTALPQFGLKIINRGRIHTGQLGNRVMNRRERTTLVLPNGTDSVEARCIDRPIIPIAVVDAVCLRPNVVPS